MQIWNKDSDIKTEVHKYESIVSPVKPFIIWTLQRTGGTNFTNKLVKLSGLKKTQDEPFNRKRELGYITTEWLQDGNKKRLRESIRDVYNSGRCIKHSMEQVPWAVSEALAMESRSAEYNHLFLYRKNPLHRLLSLEYARRTGVWGRRHLPNSKNDDVAFKKPLDVHKLIRHERWCMRLLSAAWQLLNDQGKKPVAISFEEIYEQDVRKAEYNILNILNNLELSQSCNKNKKFIQLVRGNGCQGTSNRYDNFVDKEKIVQKIKKSDHFKPDRSSTGCSVWKLSLVDKWNRLKFNLKRRNDVFKKRFGFNSKT